MWSDREKYISFLYDGKPFNQYNPCVNTYEKSGKKFIEYLFVDGLKITTEITEYPDTDAVEWVNWFENTGKDPTGHISDLHDGNITLPAIHMEPPVWSATFPNPDDEMRLSVPSGSNWIDLEFYCEEDLLVNNVYLNHLHPGDKKHYSNERGRSSDNFAPFFHLSQQGSGYIFAIGWSGSWVLDAERSTDDVTLKTGINDVDFILLPGEKFRTSSLCIMKYDGDRIDGQNKWRRFIRKHISPLGKGEIPEKMPVSATAWGGITTNQCIDRIKKITENKFQFNCFWMDAGWYGGKAVGNSKDCFEGDWGAHTGDWRPNASHPDDLIELSKVVHKAGMKFLLWFEPERANPDVPIMQEHPEYFWSIPWDKKTYLLKLGDERAWNYCYDVISESIEQIGVDILRIDYNMDPLVFWNHNEEENRKGINQIQYVNGLYRLWDAILERFPSLMIDNCAGGGRRIDLETMRRSVPLWRSDAACPSNWKIVTLQCHSQSYSQWIPYHGTGGGWTYPDIYRTRSSYTGNFGIDFNFPECEKIDLTPEEVDWINARISEYLRIQKYFYEDYYPLTEISSANDGWCASQYHCPDDNSGIIQVFRREKSPYETANFIIRGIDKSKKYIFEDIDGENSFKVTGQLLATAGLKLTLPQQRSAKIFIYRTEDICVC